MALKTDIQQEKIVFAYMLKHPDYFMKIGKDHFNNSDIQYIASTAKEFYKEYHESPSCSQMKVLLNNNPKEISNETIDSIYDIEISEYEENMLKNLTQGWIRWRAIGTNVFDAATLLKTTDVTLDNVNSVVDKAISLVSDTNLITFDNNLGLNFFDAESHVSSQEDKIPYTWDIWNKVSGGGLDNKTLHCYIGGTNVGKSIILCNDAAEFVRKGKNVLFISCEMSERKVARRIAANLFDITLEKYDDVVSSGGIKKKLQALSNMSMFPLGKLIIKEYPTGSCTVFDVKKEVKAVEEMYNIKIDVVELDYINIMCNYRNPNSENTYMKIKQLAEDLRGLAVELECLIITASQIGRSGLNGSDIELTDVSESMGLTHTCDSIIGIIQTEEMRIGDLNDSGVAIPYYWFKILKIREGKGKGTKFKVEICYDKMKLIEKIESIDTTKY